MDLCDNGSGGSLPQGFGIGHVRQYAPSASPSGAYRRNILTQILHAWDAYCDRVNRANKANKRGGGYYGDNFQRELKICLRPVLREGVLWLG